MLPAQLDDALAQLVSAELIYRRGTPPDAEYTFKHALVQDAAYSTLLRSRRQQLHARIAATLEDGFSEIVAAQPALLAHHCTEAGLAEKAVDCWLVAGRQAWGRSATEAAALLRRGLAQLSTLPDGDRRRGTELDLRLALGQSVMVSRGWGAPEAGETYARARELSVALNRSRELLFALWGQYVYHACGADLDRARPLAAEIRDLGETSGDIPTRVMGYDACAYTCSSLGEFPAARKYVEKSLALYDPAHRAFYAELMPSDMLVVLLEHSTIPSACLGHLELASSRADMALTEARRIAHPHTLVDALAWAWMTGWCIGSELELLSQWADELLAVSVEHELALYRVASFWARGWRLAASGHCEDGIQLLARGLAGLHDAGFMLQTPFWLTLLADACRMGGDWQAALGHLAEAHRFAEETGDRWALAEAVRLRGDVLLATGDLKAAEASYHEARAIAQQQSAKLWELRAATSLARLWRDQGKPAAARELLAPVYGWFTEGFDTLDLKEAKALLEDLADAPALPASGVSVVAGGAGG